MSWDGVRVDFNRYFPILKVVCIREPQTGKRSGRTLEMIDEEAGTQSARSSEELGLDERPQPYGDLINRALIELNIFSNQPVREFAGHPSECSVA